MLLYWNFTRVKSQTYICSCQLNFQAVLNFDPKVEPKKKQSEIQSVLHIIAMVIRRWRT